MLMFRAIFSPDEAIFRSNTLLKALNSMAVQSAARRVAAIKMVNSFHHFYLEN